MQRLPAPLLQPSTPSEQPDSTKPVDVELYLRPYLLLSRAPTSEGTPNPWPLYFTDRDPEESEQLAQDCIEQLAQHYTQQLAQHYREQLAEAFSKDLAPAYREQRTQEERDLAAQDYRELLARFNAKQEQSKRSPEEVRREMQERVVCTHPSARQYL